MGSSFTAKIPQRQEKQEAQNRNPATCPGDVRAARQVNPFKCLNRNGHRASPTSRPNLHDSSAAKLLPSNLQFFLCGCLYVGSGLDFDFRTPETNLALNQLLPLTRLSRFTLVNFLCSTSALKCKRKRKEVRERCRASVLWNHNTFSQPNVHEMTVKVTSNHEVTACP